MRSKSQEVYTDQAKRPKHQVAPICWYMGFKQAVLYQQYTNKFYRTALDNKKPASFVWSGLSGLYWTLLDLNLAEEQGFEPWVGSPPQRFSRPSRSTAPALLRTLSGAEALYRYPDFALASRYALLA
jgi:hypothetical protein